MMRHYSWLAAVVALFLLSQSVAAQDEQPQGQDSGALFDRVDKNGDGFITSDEVGEDRKSTFDRLVRIGDENKDGKLSKAEFVAALRDGREGQGKKDAPEGKKRPKGKDAARKFNPEAFFNRLDRNRDGKITADEVPEQVPDRLKQALKQADADGDGAVSKAEFTKAAARFGGGGRVSVEEIIKRLDKNNDRKISKEEAVGGMKENFARIDANDDGQLDTAELRKVFGQTSDKKQPKKSDKKQPKKKSDKKQPEKKGDKKQPEKKKRPKKDE